MKEKVLEVKGGYEISSDNNQMSFISEEPLFSFIPKSDITAFELAKIAETIAFQLSEPVFNKVPKSIQRHFKKEKE